jgi:hypothetical protein
MRTIVFSISLFLVILTFGLRLILIMSYTTLDKVNAEKNERLHSVTLTARFFAKLFYFFIDYRFMLGWLGLIGILIGLLIK